LVVTVMAARANQLVSGGTGQVAAQLSGMQLAFTVGAVLALVVVAMALLLPGRVPVAAGPRAHDDETDELEPIG
jgi:DHA2 family lincomycin resistance protein-like MFS transporter